MRRMFIEKRERLENTRENLNEASSTAEALKVKRDMLKQSLKLALRRSSCEDQKEEHSNYIKQMGFKIKANEKTAKDCRTGNEKEKILNFDRPDPSRNQRVSLNESTDEVHSALIDSAYTLIEKITEDPLKSIFKTHFICSKRLKSNLESFKYKEVLLHLFDFTLSVVDYIIENSSFPDPCQGKNQQNYFNSVKSSSYNTLQKFRSFNELSKVSPGCSYNEKHTQTSWIQTHPVTSQSSKPKDSEKTEKPNLLKKKLTNIGVQSDSYSFKNELNESSMKSQTDSRDSKSQLESGEIYDSSIDKVSLFIESQMADKSNEGLNKLFDESQKLLNLIDKQNSRLAKINTQILKLDPNPEQSEEDSTELPKKTERLKNFYKNQEKNREKDWPHNLIQKVPQHSANSSENIKQARTFLEIPAGEKGKKLSKKSLEKLEERPDLKSETAPSKISQASSLKLIRSALEKNPSKDDYRRITRFSTNEASEDFGSVGNTLINKRKKSGLDSSALRIPSKDNSKLNDSEFREVSSPKFSNRIASPDLNGDRFGGYVRPFLKEEKFWQGIHEHFSYQN